MAASPAWNRARAGHVQHFHHFHRSAVFVGGTFVSYPYWAGPPYYYGPDYIPRYEEPSVYVERFDGTPTPETEGEIFCPGTDAYYPDAQQCPGGWQRVIRPSG